MEKRYCKRCGAAVEKSPVEGYSWYCPEHDEDLYNFETITEDEKNGADEEDAEIRADIMRLLGLGAK